MTKILILGGYGNFGQRISTSLAQQNLGQLLIAGRHLKPAITLCDSLKKHYPNYTCMPYVLDRTSSDFAQKLQTLKPNIVIHCSGPFQNQDYRVANACIQAGAHSIDLADDRDYVCGITQLHEAACKKKVLLISGASTVPGLSSAVIDHYVPQFQALHSLEYAISPGNRASPGLATIRAILKEIGQPFTTWQAGKWQPSYSWINHRKVDFGPLMGKRWLADINIADLTLFPSRYPSLHSMRFQAGLELSFLHHTLGAMAWLSKKKWAPHWDHYAKPIYQLYQIFHSFGSDIGGMYLILRGVDQHNQPKTLRWQLTAVNGVGPFVPTLPAILLTKKLINNQLTQKGAIPCLSLFTLAEFTQLANTWGITQTLTEPT